MGVQASGFEMIVILSNYICSFLYLEGILFLCFYWPISFKEECDGCVLTVRKAAGILLGLATGNSD